MIEGILVAEERCKILNLVTLLSITDYIVSSCDVTLHEGERFFISHVAGLVKATAATCRLLFRLRPHNDISRLAVDTAIHRVLIRLIKAIIGIPVLEHGLSVSHLLRHFLLLLSTRIKRFASLETARIELTCRSKLVFGGHT